jgi:PAS domain S-box-containing protein
VGGTRKDSNLSSIIEDLMPSTSHGLASSIGLIESLLEGLPNPVFVKAEDHRWVLLNTAFCEFMGRARGELVGKLDKDFFPADETRVFWATDDQVFAGAGISENEEHFTDGSGRVHTIITRKSLHTDEQGRRLLLGVITDITDRRRVEEALKESRATLDLALRSAQMGTWHWDIVADRRRFDDQVCRLLGLDPATFTGAAAEFFAAVHPDDRERLRAAAAGAIEQGVPYDPEYRAVWPDGSIHHLCARGGVTRDPAGRPLRLDGIIWDISDRMQAEEDLHQLEVQLQQAQKLESIGRLAGGVAHDFNNLLTVILSCADEVAAGSPAQPGLIEEIRAAGKRAAELTGQLLAFARKQIIAPVPLDLNAVMRGSEKLLRRVLGEDVELVASLHPALWTVRCDPGQVEQVVLNLAVNARDAMPSGGKLMIETANTEIDEGFVALHPFMKRGPHVRLTIRDTGVGMTPAVKAHVFEPFFTTKPPGKGTGLGLAMVYGIVKQNDGYILVESEVGQGTTFRLYLPRSVAATASEPAASTTRMRGTETILLVEDDPQVRKVAFRSLMAAGYRVIVAGGGREALEVAAREKGPLHLLLTDVIMPGLNGREVAEELRRSNPGLRVLFVSGYTQDVISQSGVLGSGFEFLPKPFTASILLEGVRKALDTGS